MIIAFAGRRTDASDAPVSRFPLEQNTAVREHILTILKEQNATALVASASCGADLLALEAAGELGIRRHIVLPFPLEQFRATSVIDRPGDWGDTFDQIIGEVASTGDLVLLTENENAQDFETIFVQANTAILNEAQKIAQSHPFAEIEPDTVMAIIAWEGQSRGAGDITEDFANQARDRSIPVVEVPTH